MSILYHVVWYKRIWNTHAYEGKTTLVFFRGQNWAPKYAIWCSRWYFYGQDVIGIILKDLSLAKKYESDDRKQIVNYVQQVFKHCLLLINATYRALLVLKDYKGLLDHQEQR